MLLVIDVGNTNMKLGVYDGDVLKKSWRLSTEAKRTADELGMILYDLFKNVGVEFQDIDGIIMSSVAPMLNYTVEHMCTYYMKKKPVFVDATLKTGLKIKYNNPIELGADRIVDAVGAHFIYGGPLIVVDFGSATTFNAVTADGTFLGGAICAGVKTRVGKPCEHRRETSPFRTCSAERRDCPFHNRGYAVGRGLRICGAG